MTSDKNAIKDDDGKLEILKCPTQIIKDIAEVRMYGYKKYGEKADHWDDAEINRYINAMLRHTLEFMNDRGKVDSESGIQHYKHMACNMAFICEMMEKEKEMTFEEIQAELKEKAERARYGKMLDKILGGTE